MQRLEFSGAVRPIYGSLGVKRLNLGVTVDNWILMSRAISSLLRYFDLVVAYLENPAS